MISPLSSPMGLLDAVTPIPPTAPNTFAPLLLLFASPLPNPTLAPSLAPEAESELEVEAEGEGDGESMPLPMTVDLFVAISAEVAPPTPALTEAVALDEALPTRELAPTPTPTPTPMTPRESGAEEEEAAPELPAQTSLASPATETADGGAGMVGGPEGASSGEGRSVLLLPPVPEGGGEVALTPSSDGLGATVEAEPTMVFRSSSLDRLSLRVSSGPDQVLDIEVEKVGEDGLDVRVVAPPEEVEGLRSAAAEVERSLEERGLRLGRYTAQARQESSAEQQRQESREGRQGGGGTGAGSEEGAAVAAPVVRGLGRLLNVQA